MYLGVCDGNGNNVDAAAFLGSSLASQIANCYLDYTQSWTNGMISSYYINQCAGAGRALVTIPLLVGPRTGGTASATLSAPLVSGTPITSIPVNPLPGAITCWTMWLSSGSNQQEFSIQTPVAQGATSISLSYAQTPNFSYPTSSLVDASGSGPGQTTSPQNPSNANTPTTMTLADVASGVWDALFTDCFTTIANAQPNAILRLGWEIYGNGWWPWNGVANAASSKAAYIHLVTVARAVSPTFQFCWDGGLVYNSYDPMTQGAWPGAAYVDYVSADTYDSNIGGSAGWALVEPAAGLAFAQANGKLFAIPELGLASNGDDYEWINASAQWCQAAGASMGFLLYFNNPNTGSNALNQNQQSASVFTQLFGALARQNAGISPRFTVPGSGGRARLS